MTRMLLPLLLLSATAGRAQQPFFDTDSLLAPGATPVLVDSGFAFTEGPAVDKAGNIFFTDQPHDRIWEYDRDGRLSLFMQGTGRSNGMYFDGKGNLISCADFKDELWSISPSRKIRVLVTGYEGHRLNGPNDLWVDARGGIFFTDPYYQRPYWDRTHPDLPGQYVFYLPPGSHDPVIADSSLVKPNGIVGTPDGRILYVADIQDNKIYRFHIGPAGQLSDRTLFAPMGADGITLDDRGDLYLCGDGVTVYDPGGRKIAHLPIPEKWTANICFGGRDKKTLFLTASKSIYVVRMRVAGVE